MCKNSFPQIDLNDAQHQCVYDGDGQVKQYEKLSFDQLEDNIRIQEENRRGRPNRKEIVEFLLELIDEESEK